MEWINADEELPERGVVVDTKVHDEKGERNNQPLKRGGMNGNLWFFPDDSRYVYYRPTHWRPKHPPPYMNKEQFIEAVNKGPRSIEDIDWLSLLLISLQGQDFAKGYLSAKSELYSDAFGTTDDEFVQAIHECCRYEIWDK
jgi:hypothetical protein